MKIPMEIPEALENATKEVIDFECEAEMVRSSSSGAQCSGSCTVIVLVCGGVAVVVLVVVSWSSNTVSVRTFVVLFLLCYIF